MVSPLEESEDGNRASFPRWGKRSVVSHHFTELSLEIMDMGMLTILEIKCPMMHTLCTAVDRNR